MEISYTLPGKSRVTLRVFDLTGRTVAEPADGFQSVGTHRLVWEGRDDRGRHVPNGIYFYSFRAGDFERSGKLMVAR